MNNSKSQEAIVNKTAVVLFTILTSIIALAYVVQFIKGEAGLGLFLPVEILDLVPMILCWIIYKSNPESNLIRHVIGVGYGLFYLVLCLISTNTVLVFVYALPTILLTGMFNDLKLSISSSVGVSVIAIIHAIKYASFRNWEGGAVADLEIEILIMIVCSTFSFVVNRVIAQGNEKKVKEINEAGEKSSQMLDSIMLISNEMADEVSAVSEKMTRLANSSDEIYSAMQEVTSGTNETAESIQNQLYKTEEIQTQINRVNSASDNIGKNVDSAVEAIHEGRDNIGKLLDQAKVSEEAGNNAMHEVEELVSFTSQMQQIVELIKSVASQTSLLALNASIEAARAGEAGRGFAVVATEISNLAGQTQTATGNISDLINSLSSEMNDVVNAIDSLVESNRIQSESANVTNGSFQKIVESTREIRSSSRDLASVVTTLADANQEIVESIQTISAITEEVSAHSNTTCASSEQNKVIVGDVMKVVEQMTQHAAELENIQ